MIRPSASLCFVLLVALNGCGSQINAPRQADLPNEDADTVVHGTDGIDAFQLTSPVEVSPGSGITQRAGAWWGDVSTPTMNQVWVQAEGVTPDGRVSGDLSWAVTGQLPSPTTMTLYSLIAQVDSKDVMKINDVKPGETRILTIPTKDFPDGWHEIRIRAKAQETIGPGAGKVTAVTNGHPIYFANGNAIGTGQNTGTNYVDSHAWYDIDTATGKKIGYVYAQLRNVHSLIDAPLSGTVAVSGRVRKSGETRIDHWMVKVDNLPIFQSHGPTETQSISLDTTQFPNGPHLLSFHGHGLGASGKQLAAQVDVQIVIQNP